MVNFVIEVITTIVSSSGNEVSEFFTSFFQVFIGTAKTSLYIVFGWLLLPFSSSEKFQEYLDALGIFIFTTVLSLPQVSIVFTYLFAAIIYIGKSISEIIPLQYIQQPLSVSFKSLVRVSKFLTYLILPPTSLVSYYHTFYKDLHHVDTLANKVFCDAVNPTIANCAGSWMAKLFTYLSIIPIPNPWKIVEYVVYVIEFISGYLNA